MSERSLDDEPKRIFLEPRCCACGMERTWSQNNDYTCMDEIPATEYIRADLVEKLKDEAND